MKARLISVLLVIALLVTVGVITAQADNAATCNCASKKGVYTADAIKLNAVCDAANAMTDVANATTCPYCGEGTSVQWKKLPASGALSGHYYVDGTVNVTAAFTVSGNTCIHLNGGTIQAAETMVCDFNKSSTALNIMGDGYVIGAGASNASAIQVRSGTVRLMGGTYKHTSTAVPTIYARTGSLVIAEGTEITAVDDNVKGSNLKLLHSTVTMYGGVISNGNATNYGGNVLINPTTASHKPTFYMYGGEIYGGSAKYGGNIAIVTGDDVVTADQAVTCRLGGGKIYDGTATNNGGNIYLAAKGKTTFRLMAECIHHDIDIYNGTAKLGGNVYVVQDYLKDTTYQTSAVYLWLRDVDIYDGTATSGGNVYVGRTGVNVEIGVSDEDRELATELDNGVATRGGNLFIAENGNVKICYNAVLTGGNGGEDDDGNPVASESGGNVYCAGKLTINGELDGGYATNGGSLYCDGSSANVKLINDNARTKLATIENGTAKTYGGCVMLYNDAKFTMNSGLIQNGSVEGQDGSCIYIRHGEAKLLGGTVSSNSTTDKGTSRQGAVVLGGVKAYKSYPRLTLGGDATVTSSIGNDKESVWVNPYAKLVINAGFTGSIKLRMQSDTPDYGEQFEMNDWNEAADTIAPELIVSATGSYSGTITMLQRNNVPALFVATNEGLQVANAKDSNGNWVCVEQDFADYTLYGGKVTLAKDETLNLADGATVTAELNEKAATVNLAEGATAATFKGTNNSVAGYATVTVGEGVNANTTNKWNSAGYWDVVLPVAGNTYTYHKLDVKISAIALRTSAKGLYYRSQVNTDDTLRSQITDVGIFLGVPTGDETTITMSTAMKKITNFFGNDEETTYFDSETSGFYNATINIGPDFDWTKITSVLVENIFKTSFKDVDEDRVPEVNRVRGEAPIVGVPYVVLAGDKVLTAQSHVEKSMKNYMEMVDEVVNNTNKITNAQKQDLLGFYHDWMRSGFDGWTLPNLRQAYAESQAPADSVE